MAAYGGQENGIEYSATRYMTCHSEAVQFLGIGRSFPKINDLSHRIDSGEMYLRLYFLDFIN